MGSYSPEPPLTAVRCSLSGTWEWTGSCDRRDLSSLVFIPDLKTPQIGQVPLSTVTHFVTHPHLAAKCPTELMSTSHSQAGTPSSAGIQHEAELVSGNCFLSSWSDDCSRAAAQCLRHPVQGKPLQSLLLRTGSGFRSPAVTAGQAQTRTIAFQDQQRITDVPRHSFPRAGSSPCPAVVFSFTLSPCPKLSLSA